jgi:hypothetical protein
MAKAHLLRRLGKAALLSDCDDRTKFGVSARPHSEKSEHLDRLCTGT